MYWMANRTYERGLACVRRACMGSANRAPMYDQVKIYIYDLICWVRLGFVFSFEIYRISLYMVIVDIMCVCVLRCAVHTKRPNNTSSAFISFPPIFICHSCISHATRRFPSTAQINIKYMRKLSHSMFSCSFPDLAYHYRYIYIMYISYVYARVIVVLFGRERIFAHIWMLTFQRILVKRLKCDIRAFPGALKRSIKTPHKMKKAKKKNRKNLRVARTTKKMEVRWNWLNESLAGWQDDMGWDDLGAYDANKFVCYACWLVYCVHVRHQCY